MVILISYSVVEAANTPNVKLRAILAQCLSHTMSAVAWSSKAFTNSLTVKLSKHPDVFQST